MHTNTAKQMRAAKKCLLMGVASNVYMAFLKGVSRRFRRKRNESLQGLPGRSGVLSTSEEFEARLASWIRGVRNQGWRQVWAGTRDQFFPSFRAEIDRIVAEVGG